MVYGCPCFSLITETIFSAFSRLIILKVGSLTLGIAWPPQCHTVARMRWDTEQMGQTESCRIGILLMGPSWTLERIRPGAGSESWWVWNDFKVTNQ